MKSSIFLLTLLSVSTLAYVLPTKVHAYQWFCQREGSCGNSSGGRSKSQPAQPSTSSTISLNPAAVPTEDTFGAEALYYKRDFDFALVKGLGRVGAAISPSNNEETFFGPPGFEFTADLLERKTKALKYPSQKLTFATAFSIFQNKKNGLRRFDVNLGVIAKYNKLSNRSSAGGGISGVAGPITFGYASYKDSYVYDYEKFGIDQKDELVYTVETISGGLSLESFAFDYSVLRLHSYETSTVAVATGSLLLKKAMITVAHRRELSTRPSYNYQTKSLESINEKSDVFGGVQYAVTKNLMPGVFYNYYLLREISLGITAFF